MPTANSQQQAANPANPANSALPPVLRISQLVKSFHAPDGTPSVIVDVPTFEMPAQGHIALQGASGTGKTTFLNLIAGILSPDRGEIEVAGETMTRTSESARDLIRARHIGYIFQTFNLLQGYTALENVLLGMMFGRGPDTAFARSLLERVGLKDRLDYKPRQLSVGQQQRVAVARALANHPKLVLADEPTGNLDHKLAQEAMRLIRETCRENGASLLLVSHDREILEQFENVQHLDQINRAGQIQAADRSTGPETGQAEGEEAGAA